MVWKLSGSVSESLDSGKFIRGALSLIGVEVPAISKFCWFYIFFIFLSSSIFFFINCLSKALFVVSLRRFKNIGILTTHHICSLMGVPRRVWTPSKKFAAVQIFSDGVQTLLGTPLCSLFHFT